jgi:hypothetical protein
MATTRCEGLTPVQRKAIAALLTSATQIEAAQLTGIKARTLQRWLKEPAFAGELKKQEGEALAAVTRQLVVMASASLETIRQVLTDGQVAPGVRLRAAEAVLANLLKIRELVDLEDRVTTLEGKVKYG